MPSKVAYRRMDVLSVLVATYVALLPFQFQVGPRRAMMNFAPADCILPLLVLLAPGQLKYRKPAWTVWHLGVLVVFAVGSFVFSLRSGVLNRYELLNKDVGLLLLFLTYAAITSTAIEWQDIRRLLRVLVCSVVLQNLVAVASFLAGYQWGIQTPFVEYGGTRLAGMLLDPNAYGGLLVLTLVICEAASWGPAPLLKGLPLLVSKLTLSLGILLTFSRSAWIAMGVAFMVLCVVRHQVAIRLALVGLVCASGLLLAMGSRFLGFFEHMAIRPQQGVNRFAIIQDALAEFAQHPILGGGLGSFRVVHQGTPVHNTAFWFMADFGLVGLVAVAGFLGWFFFKAWFTYRFAAAEEKPLALALLLGHTAMLGLAMGIEAFYQRHWWLIMALIASSYSIVRRQLSQPAPDTVWRLETDSYSAPPLPSGGVSLGGTAKMTRGRSQFNPEQRWNTSQ